MGCGCLFRMIGLLVLIFFGMVVGACVLATRPVGPSFENGVFSYNLNGERREVRLSSEAARRFDGKLAGQLSNVEAAQAALVGVTVSEEELNSRVAEELAARGLVTTAGGQNASIERVFIRLAEGGARAYVYTNAGPTAVTVSTDLSFQVESGRITANIDNTRAGRLPVDWAVTRALDLFGERERVEEAMTVVIPPQVRELRVEEGRLRAFLNLSGQ